MKKISLLLLSLTVAVSSLILPCAGCAGEVQTVTLTDVQTVTSTITKTIESTTVVDDLGREVTIEGAPSRIVALGPSNTEILFALGLGDKVYGVTEWCDYPPEAMEKEKVGGYSDVDLEKVVAIDPDLILRRTCTSMRSYRRWRNWVSGYSPGAA